MNKKFLSALLYGTLITVPASTFVSCNDYDDDISSLQEQVDKNAETAKSELEAQISALRSQISALESAKDGLSQELAAAKQACAQASSDALSAAQKAMSAAEAAKDGGDAAKLAAEMAQKAADDAAKTLSMTVATVSQLETKVASMESAIAKLQDADRDFSIQLITINEALSTLQQNVKANTDGIAGNKQAIADALAKINAMESALRTSINEVASTVGAKIDVINAELNNIKSIYATNDALNAKYNELVATNARLEEQIKTNANYVAALQATVKELASKDAELAEALKSNYSSIIEKLTATNTELGVAAAKISALETTVATLTTQYNALSASKADITYVDNINTQLTKLIEGLQKTMSDMTASNASQDRSIEVLMNDVKTLQKGLTDLEHLVGDNAEEAKKQLEAAVSKLQGEIAETVSGVQANLDAAVAELNRQIAEDKQELANVKEELNGKIGDVLGKLLLTQGEVTELTADLIELQGEVSDMKVQVALDIAAAVEAANKYTDAAVEGLTTRINGNVTNINTLLEFKKALNAIGGEDLSKLVTDEKLTEGLMTAVDQVLSGVAEDYLSKQEFTLWFNNQLTGEILPQYVKDSELNGKIESYLAQPGGLNDRVKTVETQLNGDGTSTNPGIISRVETIETYLEDLGLIEAKLAKRLTSLTFVPSAYIDGIPTMQFKTFCYQYGGKTFTKENDNATKVIYRMNPSGVNVESINEADITFLANMAVNTRAGVTSPIEYVKGSAQMVGGDLVLNVKKTQATLNSGANFNGRDNFYIAALGVPVADQYLTTDEKANGGAVVYSDFVRLSESRFTADLTAAKRNGLVHLWSKDLYQSNPNDDNTIYIRQKYSDDLDLLSLVGVCEEVNDKQHVAFTDYETYGLTIKFAVEGSYEQGDQKTDQQKFAKVIEKDGKQYLRSIVYEGGEGLEKNPAAIDREPIVTVRLIDTANGNVVVTRYFKVKWASDSPVDLGEIKGVTLPYSCGDYTCSLTTAEMNKLIYAKVGQDKGGMSSATFHTLYPDNNLSIVSGAGSFKLNKDLINGVTSYNLTWDVSNEEIGQTLTGDKEVTAKFKWESADKRGDVTFELKMKVTAPKFGMLGYNAAYWDDAYTFITMNPIVYGTENAKERCTINIDLVNSFVDGNATPAAVLEEAIKKIGFSGDITADIEFDNDNLNKLGLAYVSTDGKVLYIKNKPAARIVLDDSGKYVLALEEANGTGSSTIGTDNYGDSKSYATDEAVSLLGKSIPVRVNVSTCENGEYLADRFDVRVIKPFEVQSEMTDVFYESMVNGSRVSVAEALEMKDWNGYYVSQITPANADEKHKWAAQLYEYYGISKIEWDVDNCTTNLRPDGNGNLVVGADGSKIMPDGAAFTYDSETDELVYMNNGTVLGKEFVITCPVKVYHKWGEEVAHVKITVKPGSGE